MKRWNWGWILFWVMVILGTFALNMQASADHQWSGAEQRHGHHGHSHGNYQHGHGHYDPYPYYGGNPYRTPYRSPYSYPSPYIGGGHYRSPYGGGHCNPYSPYGSYRTYPYGGIYYGW